MANAKEIKKCLYISDTHFGHTGVIGFDKRPFNNANEMDEAIITLWKESVTDDDRVYVLGDFSWHKEEETLRILDELPGEKILIKGNHDKVSPKIARKYSGVYNYLEVNDSGRRVILSHYPMLFWNGQFRDSVHLYGHVHVTKQQELCERFKDIIRKEQDLKMRMYNVGCMMPWMNYMPRTLDEIENYINQIK